MFFSGAKEVRQKNEPSLCILSLRKAYHLALPSTAAALMGAKTAWRHSNAASQIDMRTHVILGVVQKGFETYT